MEKFKVGDVVYDEVNYPNEEGIINEIDILGEFPINVIFNNQSECYTLDGRIFTYAANTLSLTPYTIEFKGFTQERPKVLTDEMKVCYVGKKIEYNGSICLIIQQDKNSIDYFFDGQLNCISISENITNGKYRIID